MSSDIPLVKGSIVKSSKLNDGSMSPSGPVEMSEAASDNREPWRLMGSLDKAALCEWVGKTSDRDSEFDKGLIEAEGSAPTAGGSGDPSGWLDVSTGEASEDRISVKKDVGIQSRNKNLRSWDSLGCQSLAERRTTILNYEVAMTEQSHSRRCDHCQSLRTGFQNFCVHQSAGPRQLLRLKGPAVVEGADPEHGVLIRVAPLIRGRRRAQQVQLAADKSTGGGYLAFAQAQVY